VLLVGAASFGMWFFLTLYLQQVLGYSALRAGLAFLPMTLCIVAGSTIASRAVRRVGAKPLLVAGMLAFAAGLWLLGQVPAHGSYAANVLPGSLLCAIGIGFAFVTGTIAAVSGVPARQAGLASGLVNTSRMFGGALGLAVLATIAASRTSHDLHRLSADRLAGGHEATAPAVMHAALTGGFRLAFTVGAAFALTGALAALFGLPQRRRRGPSGQQVPRRALHGQTQNVLASPTDEVALRPLPDKLNV
jgi:MFS family permease